MNTRRLAASAFFAAMIAQAAGPARAVSSGRCAYAEADASACMRERGAGLQSPQTPAAPAQAPWMVRLSAWLDAVRTHSPGTVDMPARLLGFWSEQDLYNTRSDLFALVAICRRELGRSARPPQVVYKDAILPFRDLQNLLGLTDEEAAAGNANRILQRGAVLHADIAMHVIPLLPFRAGCAARESALMKDGNNIGVGCVGAHWIYARALLDAVKPDPGRDRVVRLWYRATITWLLGMADFANADLQIPHGQRLFPEDPVIRFEHGCYHEAFASPFVQMAALEADTDRRSPRIHLEEAADHFRRAIDGKPPVAEARVHLGFVLGELGRHREAAEELRRAIESAPGTQLRYYAELFLGRAEESLGNAGAARDHYVRAAGLYPRAQSPQFSLMLLARQQGGRAAAMATMRQALESPHAERERTDPWWNYYRWQTQEPEALFAELYRLVFPEIAR